MRQSFKHLADSHRIMLALPRKKESQSLHGYVLEHLRQLERELLVGVPYRTLAGAMRATGFRKIAVRSMRTAVYRARKKRARHFVDMAVHPVGRSFLDSATFEMPPRLSAQAPDERAAFGRRFRELARPPASGEADPLV